MKHLRALIWSTLLLLGVAWASQRVLSGATPLDADFLSLIGASSTEQQDSTQAETDLGAVRHLLAQDGQRAVFMISAALAEQDQALVAANDLRTRLAALRGSQQVTLAGGDAGRYQALLALYLPYVPALLSSTDRLALQSNQAEALFSRAVQALYQPTSALSGAALRHDPFSLLPGFLSEAAQRWGQHGAMITQDGRVHLLLTVTLDPSLRSSGQDDTWSIQALAARQAVIAAAPSVSIEQSGQIFFATAEARRAKSDVQRISMLATFGILAMVWAVFRSWLPLLQALITVGCGLAAGLTAVVLVFDSLHVLALVFGSSLIGIAVDYALHFLTANGDNRLQHIRPGLTLGLITSVCGFAALALSPTPVLGQIALYSTTGLIAAYLCVLWLLPYFPSRPAQPWRPLARGLQQIFSLQQSLCLPPMARRVALGVIFGGAVLCALLVRGNDDIRAMGSADPALLAQTRHIDQLFGAAGNPLFIRILGPSLESRLQREEQLRDRLTPLIQSGRVRGMVGQADFIPSAHRQQQNRTLVHNTLYAPFADRFAAMTGIHPTLAESGKGPLRLDAASLKAIPELADLGDDNSSILRLRGVSDAAALSQALDGLEGVRLVTPTATLSQMFGHFRAWAYAALGLALAAGTLLALWRYGPLPGLCIIAAPAGAVVVALAVSQALGIPHTFFTTMGLLLVFAIGADYALFFAESAAQLQDSTRLAVFLSLVSSLLAFGLLATATAPLVRDLGAVIAIGLVAAWVFAPMMAAPSNPKKVSPK